MYHTHFTNKEQVSDSFQGNKIERIHVDLKLDPCLCSSVNFLCIGEVGIPIIELWKYYVANLMTLKLFCIVCCFDFLRMLCLYIMFSLKREVKFIQLYLPASDISYMKMRCSRLFFKKHWDESRHKCLNVYHGDFIGIFYKLWFLQPLNTGRLIMVLCSI